MKRDRARPERSRGENLDETIDRVAGAMTSVTSDPALVARIAQRVEADQPWTLSWARLGFAAAGLAAVAVLAVVTSTTRREAADPGVAAENAPAVAAARPTASEAATPAGVSATMVRQPATARRHRTITHTSEVPQIEALPSPVLLEVEGIASDVLTVAPVDLAPLDLGNLALTEADSRDNPKE